MASYFDTCYCINLDRNRDRWEQFQERLPLDWPFPPVQRYQAVDALLAPPPLPWQSTIGAWGCYRSHLRIIEDCLNNGIESVLILEDDAMFCQDFSRKASQFLSALPLDWEYIYLGGKHMDVALTPPRRYNEFVFTACDVNMGHAYALRGDSLRSVYSHLSILEWSAGNAVDRHLRRYQKSTSKPVYCPAEWLIDQIEGFSSITNTYRPTRHWPSAVEIEAFDINDCPFVVVLGSPSSCASLVAGVLNQLGVHLGRNLSPFIESDPSTWHRSFEALRLRTICERGKARLNSARERHDPVITQFFKRWISKKKLDALDLRTIAGAKHSFLSMFSGELLQACGKSLFIINCEHSLKREEARLNVADRLHGKKRSSVRLDVNQLRFIQGVDSRRVFNVKAEALEKSAPSVIDDLCSFLPMDISSLRIELAKAWLHNASKVAARLNSRV